MLPGTPQELMNDDEDEKMEIATATCNIGRNFKSRELKLGETFYLVSQNDRER